MLFQSLVSEPVFIFPVLSFFLKISFDNSILLLLILFQTLSIFSLQLGKVTPPNFQIGFVSSLLTYSFLRYPLSFSILVGIFSSLIFGYFYIIKRRINFYLSRSFKIELALFLSIMITFFSYLFFLYSEYFLLTKLQLFKTQHNNVFIVSIFLTLTQIKYVKVNKKIETILFFMGILLGLFLCLKIKLNWF
ncbi:MAG: hypothetical protein ABIN35_02315 [candidate division WOR-3 bacterium]